MLWRASRTQAPGTRSTALPWGTLITSCPFMQGTLKQQVFISHTGQDDGAKTFAACILKPALERAGIEVYMDFASLMYGEQWKQKLVEAAACSQVMVVVLSRSYTSRFWCMLELDLALNGRPGAGPNPVIIPVFYDEWSVVSSGPDEVTRSGVTAKWQGMVAECSGDKLQQWLRDEELDVQWQACVDVERWGTNMRAMKDIQHRRRTACHGKDEQLNMAMDVVAAALGHVVHGVDVDHVVGLEECADELLAKLAVADPGTQPLLGLWLHGFGKCWLPTFVVCTWH
jgi:hypothetical protein